MPFALELMLQIEIVLDDPVVHHDDAAGAVAVRMGVLFGGTSVRGPAGMPDAVLTVDRAGRDDLFEPRQLAGAAAQFDGSVVNDRDAGRVVAAVFEPPQAIDQDGYELLRTD